MTNFSVDVFMKILQVEKIIGIIMSPRHGILVRDGSITNVVKVFGIELFRYMSYDESINETCDYEGDDIYR